ncbi:hypothetical protein D0Y65_045777 [Glycine soja]|uniref:Uncharacterized protein n=1 Tax=Glycine soja TaxID=3848 RepID=A0A445G6J4_GLYSO|nr:hypothetical protein glysoja_017099 [Glycine soja]RZB56815.1 hypothetical protein D0Y65_045777 [Glycine soja]
MAITNCSIRNKYWWCGWMEVRGEVMCTRKTDTLSPSSDIKSTKPHTHTPPSHRTATMLTRISFSRWRKEARVAYDKSSSNS